MRIIAAILAIVLAVAIVSITGGGKMAKVFLFSRVVGVALFHGKPAEGAEIERTCDWAWGGKVIVDKTIAGPDGGFQFPVVKRMMLLGSILPHQPVITQTINIQYQGKTYKAWAHTKMDYEKNSELRGSPIVVTCHLERERTHIMGGDSPYGLCELRENLDNGSR